MSEQLPQDDELFMIKEEARNLVQELGKCGALDIQHFEGVGFTGYDEEWEANPVWPGPYGEIKPGVGYIMRVKPDSWRKTPLRGVISKKSD